MNRLITTIKKENNTIVPIGTDIIGVLKETNESNFMGGVHGNEKVYDIYLLVDGVPCLGSTTANRIDIIMNSHLYRVSSGINVIDRFVHIVIQNNSIKVNTTFKCLVDNFSLKYSYNGGMFAWYDNDKSYATTNIGRITGDSGATNHVLQQDDKLYRAEVMIYNGFVTCENTIGHEENTYNGEAFYYGGETNPRMKMYFATDKNSVWNTGHICIGESVYTFN